MYQRCKECSVDQLRRLATSLDLDDAATCRLVDTAEGVLASYDDSPTVTSSPEAMGRIWCGIESAIGTDDPYVETKRIYNELVASMADEIERRIAASGDPAQLALRFAAIGNLIDFGTSGAFDETKLHELIDRAPSLSFGVDDTRSLLDRVRHGKTLLYLSDNCGEISLDKILIRQLKRENPALEVTYCVRELPILNDLTLTDAAEANMTEVARVIANGDDRRAAGTVLEHCSDELRTAFGSADVVISKGQGNFETLWGCDRDVFFMFIAKCQLAADLVGCDYMDLICREKPAA